LKDDLFMVGTFVDVIFKSHLFFHGLKYKNY